MPVIGGYDSPADPFPYPAGTPIIGYDNIVTGTNIYASFEAPGFPASNVANPATHLVWQGTTTGTGGGDFFIFPSADKPISYVAFAGHNLGSIGLDTCYVSDQAVSPHRILAQIDPPDWGAGNKPMIVRFPPVTTGSIGIDLFHSSPLSAPPQIAVLYAGELLTFERGVKVDVTHTPITMGRQSNIVGGMREFGNFLGRLKLGETRASRAEFFGFTRNFFVQNLDRFLDVAQDSPFFWAWAPQDYPLETGYAWLTENPQPEQSTDTQTFALTLNMKGIS
jgi:hypothetical protein